MKVPVNSFDSAIRQIDAGADEIYMGMNDEFFSTMSFSARAQITSHGVHSTLSPLEFQRTLNYAHSKNVAVNYTVNCQYMSCSCNDFMRKRYLRHVLMGVEMGVDALIVSDIGNIIYLKQEGITTPIIAGSYLSAFNTETLRLLSELGVVRVCLPDQMKLEEIEELKSSTKLEIEVFIGYGCSNISSSCNFCHNNGEQLNVGVTCRDSYYIQDECEFNILDACCNCAICAIPSLINIGVDSVKLIGREIDSEDLFDITKMYRSAIDSYLSTGLLNKESIIAQIPWWKTVMCSNRCKYSSHQNNIYRSYV